MALNDNTTEIPVVDWGLTPITDETFIRQKWERINITDDNNLFYQFEDDDDPNTDFVEFMNDDDDDGDEFDDNFGAEDAEDAYYWILKLPRESELDLNNGCPVLISSLSNEKINGLKKGQYFVQLHDFFDLGICFSEEEIEILYRSLCSKDICDFK
jgi:hypothetical protein